MYVYVHMNVHTRETSCVPQRIQLCTTVYTGTYMHTYIHTTYIHDMTVGAPKNIYFYFIGFVINIINIYFIASVINKHAFINSALHSHSTLSVWTVH
jgi:hypothetical protein